MTRIVHSPNRMPTARKRKHTPWRGQGRPGKGKTSEQYLSRAVSLRAPYLMESAVSVERQFAARTTVALSYVNTRGLHQYLTNDINGALPLASSTSRTGFTRSAMSTRFSWFTRLGL